VKPGSILERAARLARRAGLSRPAAVRGWLLADGRGKAWLTPILGFRALCDEALLSACLISAIAAVVAPIMILAGLKFGFIEVLRDKFIQDPSFRLITPREAQTRPQSFFVKLMERGDVAFVQPQVNLSNTSAPIEGSGDRRQSFDIIPTSAGDPLIVENEGAVPLDGEVTLTASGAKALDVEPGAEIKLMIYRSLAGRREVQQVPLRVRSVLRAAADPERRAYVGLDLIQAIENYRAGIPVASRGWTGLTTPPQQVFNTAFVVLDSPLDEVEIHTIRVRYGFAESTTPDLREFAIRTGLDAGGAPQIIRFANRGRPVRAEQLVDMTRQLSDGNFRLLPWVEGLEAVLQGEQRPLPVRAFDPTRVILLGQAQTAAPAWQGWRSNASFAQADRILIPARLAHAYAPGARIGLTVQPGSPDDATQQLNVTLTVDGFVDSDAIMVPPALAGMLLQARSVALRFDPVLDTLLPADVGLRGFRAYAKTIDDVPVIAHDLEAQGIEVRTKADAVEQLQRLDRALTRITMIVAAVALLGGSAVLIASFYAAVERKKGDLSLLRLLGFSRGNIFSLPILQSVMLGTVGFCLALLLFAAFAKLINVQYATDLTVNGSICRLKLDHVLAFGLASLGVASLSSLLAANRTLKIDPAEALRQE
jgi:putative ABC transport system permease protein